ncbi:hypothetical protein [Hydrogenimonas sp.]
MSHDHETYKLKVEIARVKLVAYLAIGGGSWMYVVQEKVNVVLGMAAWALFSLASVGIFLNLLKLSHIEKSLSSRKEK